MSYLSDEQMACVGVPREANPAWRLIDLPTGRQQLPSWAKGLHVDFVDEYDNDPRFRIKADRDLRRWEPRRYRRESDLFMAVSDDGRAEAYYQGGPLRLEKLKRFQTLDGVTHIYRPNNPDLPSGPVVLRHGESIDMIYAPGKWVEVERLCTRQERGFGGAHVDLVMEDGTEVTLRGPWHGPCPPGFVEVGYTDMSDRDNASRWHRRRPWWQRHGGLTLIRTDLFVRIFSTFAPHLRLAAVDLGRGERLQPLKPEWDEPKAWVRARARMARKQAAWDAMPPAERPPHVACNWPKVCGGKTHCAVAACNHCTKVEAA